MIGCGLVVLALLFVICFGLLAFLIVVSLCGLVMC